MYTSIKAENRSGKIVFKNCHTGKEIVADLFHQCFIQQIIDIAESYKTYSDVLPESNLVIIILDDTLDQIKSLSHLFNDDLYAAIQRLCRIFSPILNKDIIRSGIYIHNLSLESNVLRLEVEIPLGGTARTEMTVKVRI